VLYTKAGKSKYVLLFVRIVVVAAGVTWAVVWAWREQRWSSLAAIFLGMNLGVFAVTLSIFVISQIMMASRWWLLLRTQSVFIGFGAVVRLLFLGLFYNNFMPSSIGGDLLRAWYVTKHTDKRFEAALSVVVDRVIGLLSTLIIAIFFYWLFLRGQGCMIVFGGQSSSVKFLAEHKWGILWMAVILAAVFCTLLSYKQGRRLLTKAWSCIRMRSLSIFEKLKNALTIYCRNPLVILGVFGLTFFLQVLAITGFWFLGVNLGITASIKYYYVFFALAWVLGSLPISIGGVVVVEGSLAYLFIHFAGVEPEAALALALCQRMVWMIASLPGAAIHLMGAHLPKDFFIDYNKSIN